LSFSAAARQIAAGKPRLVFNRGRVRAQHGRRRRQLPACGRGQSVLVAAEGSMCPPPQDHQGSLSIDAGVAAMLSFSDPTRRYSDRLTGRVVNRRSGDCRLQTPIQEAQSETSCRAGAGARPPHHHTPICTCTTRAPDRTRLTF